MIELHAGTPPGPGIALPHSADVTERSKRDVMRWALFLFVLITIGRVHSHVPFVGRLRPAALIFLVCVAWALLVPRAVSWKNLTETWPPKVLLGLGLVACLSAPLGISLGRSGSFILDSFSKTLIMALLMIAGIRSVRDLALFVWGFVLSAGIWAFQATFRYQLQTDSAGTSRLNDLVTFDANDLGLVMVTALPLTLLTFESARRRLPKLLSLAILVGISVTIAKTGSRGAFVGLVAVGGGLVVGLRHIAVTRRVGAVVVVALGLLVAAPTGYWQRMATLASPTEDYNWTSGEGRKQIALRGMGYMLSGPVGIGISNFSRAECTIATKVTERAAGTGFRCTAPHNSYVEVGSELGVPGLLLWVSILLGGTIGLKQWAGRIPVRWRKGSEFERFLAYSAIYLPVSFIGFAVSATFVSFAYLEPFYILTAYMAGLIALVERRLRVDRLANIDLAVGRHPTRVMLPTGHPV